jgi:hypothetical protein
MKSIKRYLDTELGIFYLIFRDILRVGYSDITKEYKIKFLKKTAPVKYLGRFFINSIPRSKPGYTARRYSHH